MDAYRVTVEIRNETDDYVSFHPWEPVHGHWHTAAGAEIAWSAYVNPGATETFTLENAGLYGAEGSFNIRLVAEDGAPGVMYDIQAHAACPVLSDNAFGWQWHVVHGIHTTNDFLEVESAANAGGNGVQIGQTLPASGNPVEVLFVLRKRQATMPLDVWGEGRMRVDGLVTGFEHAYNLNRHDKGQGWNNKGRIPNLIPVLSWAPDVLPIPTNTILQMASMGSPLYEPGVVLGMRRILHRTDPAARIYLYSDKQNRFFTGDDALGGEEAMEDDIKRMENWAAFETWLDRLKIRDLKRLAGPVDAQTLPAPFNEIRMHGPGKNGKPRKTTWAWVYGFA
ncbi:hypothetical protein [Lysobacter hankyongensis]|uniref:Uncharacterized protein n=1 Tax=Lysobacter hankyongensis TaxID=1176535 RepID=A0ABP9AVR5_9GAMM